MSAEAITLALLEAAPGVTVLVGSRIYFDSRPEGDPLPALVYQVVSDLDVPPIAATPGSIPAQARIQINCLAASAEARTALAEQVYQAGVRQSGEIAATHVQAVFPERGPSSYDAMVDTYQQPVDYLIHYIR